MRVIRAHEMHFVSEHSLEAHPDVGLDVLRDVPDVKRAVGVGERGSDKKLAGHPASLPEISLPASAPLRAARWPGSPAALAGVLHGLEFRLVDRLFEGLFTGDLAAVE